MSLFTVDQEKCTKCGACVDECPSRIVTIKPDGFPAPAENLTERCINCGHCVAVCPRGAMSLKRMAIDACPPVNKQWLLSPEQTEHFLRSRRSIRAYKKEPVDKSAIDKLINIARYAPTGHNSQPLRWKVIYDNAEVKRFAELTIGWMKHLIETSPDEAKLMSLEIFVTAWERGIDMIFRGAPHLVVCHAHKSNRFAPTSATIALAYLELAALPLGLGACWAGYFNMACNNWQPQIEVLGLPAGNVPLGALMIGYPKYKFHRLPQRNKAVISWK